MMKKRVVIAMSGGVDSSTTALYYNSGNIISHVPLKNDRIHAL